MGRWIEPKNGRSAQKQEVGRAKKGRSAPKRGGG